MLNKAKFSSSSCFFCLFSLFALPAHDHDEQHQELRVPSVWASPQFAWLARTASSHPLGGPPLQLRCLRRALHRHQQLQQVGLIIIIIIISSSTTSTERRVICVSSNGPKAASLSHFCSVLFIFDTVSQPLEVKPEKE